MTKQHAYELAEAEHPNGYFEVYDRAMEIYAAAFTEWVEEHYVGFRIKTRLFYEKSACEIGENMSRLTASELITQFEKQP